MSKQIIKYGEGGLAGNYSPLIPFSCIFDIPVGLIILISKEYRAEDVFDIKKIDDLIKDRRDLILYLYQREFENPLLDFMINPNYEEAEDMYKQFMNTRYEDILKNCVHTGIYELCLLFADTSDINLGIYYTKKEELELLESDPNLKSIRFLNGRELIENIDSYSQYFINTLYGTFVTGLMKRLTHRNIYILDYKYNFNQEGEFVEAPSIIGFEAARNTLNIINAYDISRLRKDNIQ